MRVLLRFEDANDSTVGPVKFGEIKMKIIPCLGLVIAYLSPNRFLDLGAHGRNCLGTGQLQPI